jgi:KaiC/GvpD/RAD55 family RecA-like ATPase
MADTTPVLGIPEIDAELAPVLPRGWLALLEGRPGSGMPLLAKQFAHAGAPGTPVVYYSSYERDEDVARAFQDFGWKTDGIKIVNLAEEYYDRVLRRDLEVSRTREQGLTFKDLAGAPTAPVQRRTFNLQNRLLADFVAIDGPFRLVLDSFDFFLELLEPQQVTLVARQIRHLAQQFGGQALLVIHAEIHEASTRGLLESMADLVLELRVSPRPESYEHVLDIRKVRNHPELTRSPVVRASPHGLEVALPAPDTTASPRR